MTKEISVFTDGGMRSINGRMNAGWGFYGETPDSKIYTGYGASGIGVSNNVAELSAAVKALEFCIAKGFDIIHMFLDSQYVILCMNDIEKCEENDYLKNGVPVKNESYRRHLANLKEEIISKNIQVNFEWVKGHSGIYGNEQADVLATRGVIAQSNDDIQDHYSYPEEEVIEVEEAKKEKTPKLITLGLNPLITARDWYFKTNTSNVLENGDFIYTNVTFDKDPDDRNKNAGKVSSDSHYCVLVTPNAIEPLEKIKASFNKHNPTSVAHVLVYSEFIRREIIWKELTHAYDSFIEIKGSLALTPDKELVAEVIKVPKLIFRLQDYFTHGLNIINRFKANDPSLMVLNNTAMFVSTDKKGKFEVNKDFTNQEKKYLFKHIKMPNDRFIDVTINVGIDMPNRNQISNIIKEDNKESIEFYLILWDITEKSYRCGTLIKRKEDIAFYYTSESSYRIIDK